MSFRVDPVKLEAYQKVLAPDLALQSGTARQYLAQHVTLSEQAQGVAGKALWSVAIGNLAEARAAIEANLARLGEVTTASSAELGATAQMYRRTDVGIARALDATY